MTAPVLPGAEAWSHDGALGAGVLALHGFTGNPSSMRGLAEALAARRLPRRAAAPARARHDDRRHDHDPLGRLDGRGRGGLPAPRRSHRLGRRRRAEHGRLADAVDRARSTPRSPGSCASTRPPCRRHPRSSTCSPRCSPTGTETMPGIGTDIADPDVVEIAYEGTPLRALLSLMIDGLAPMSERYGELKMPLLLFTSHQDHVVEPAGSEYLAAHYGGTVEHTLARAQLPRGDAGLRPRPDLRRDRRVRQAGHRAQRSSTGDVSDRRCVRDVSGAAGQRDRDRAAQPARLRLDDRPRRRRRASPCWAGCSKPSRSAPATTPARSRCGPSAAGIVGARLYHVATDWERFDDDLGAIPKIWQGGLGIPGGLVAGIASRHVRRPPARPRRGAGRDVRGSDDPARAGDRAVGQLVQPGAVRQAHRSAVGARGRRRQGAAPDTRRARRSIRRSSTSRCGTSVCSACCC